MKVAITGANGFVGSALCRKLQSSHQLLCITRQAWLPAIHKNIVTVDYSSTGFIEALKGCDCVIHLAAKTHSNTKPSQKNLQIYRQVNVKNTLELANAALSAGVKRFIYLSSIKVNGEETFGTPFSALDQPKPEDAYGISKWEAEQALTLYFRETPVELVIIRPPLIWDKQYPKGNLKLLSKWMSWGLALPFKTTNNQRDLLSLDNLCDFISLCITHPDVSQKTLLISDGISRTSLEIASLLGSAKFFSIPKWMTKLAHKTSWGRRLFGDLQIDINPTIQLTGWKPHQNIINQD